MSFSSTFTALAIFIMSVSAMHKSSWRKRNAFARTISCKYV